MTLAAIASSSLGSASGLAWALPATAETVEVKTAYGRLHGTRKGDLLHSKAFLTLAPSRERIVSGPHRHLCRGLVFVMRSPLAHPHFSRTGPPSESKNQFPPKTALCSTFGRPPWI